jgi:hypothetical protein
MISSLSRTTFIPMSLGHKLMERRRSQHIKKPISSSSTSLSGTGPSPHDGNELLAILQLLCQVLDLHLMMV